MMQRQQQREKPTTNQAPRRSSVLEIVLGTLHLLLGGSFVMLMLIAFRDDGIGSTSWYEQFTSIMGVLMGLCTGLAGLLLLCRQRRVAAWFQWISTLATLITSIMVLYMRWQQEKDPFSSFDWITVGIYCGITLWMAGFAWFLKKQEDAD